MHSFSIYTGISHINQLLKLNSALIEKIRAELDEIAGRFGGRPIDPERYIFLPSMGEVSRKTAEAAAAMHDCLRRYHRELYGTTVLVVPEDTAGHPSGGVPDHLLLQVPEENGLWLVPSIADEFSDYMELHRKGALYLAVSLLEAGPRFEERLSRLLVRKDRLAVVRLALESLETDQSDRTVLLLRGAAGSGKRATLREVLNRLYPDDGGVPLIIPFSENGEDPMEPFVRALGTVPASIAEYLDDEEADWWESEGENLIERTRKGLLWNSSRDQVPVDFVQAFALCVKAHIRQRRAGGRPAYLLVDAVDPDSEALAWLRSLITEFLETGSFRLILIRDTEDFDEVLPLPGKGHVVGFQQPASSEWKQFVGEASLGPCPNDKDLAMLADQCGANLFRLFHALLARESGADPAVDPGEALVSSLDPPTRTTLFLAHAAAGLADRETLGKRFRNEDEGFRESVRCDGLIHHGLIREDPDGLIRGIPDGPTGALAPSSENNREARSFGRCLFRLFESGKPMNLARLFRYLEAWGPEEEAIAVLDKLLEGLLAQRRLRLAGILLSQTFLARKDLDRSLRQSLQNIMGAARLRYVLLTGGAEDARGLMTDGTVSLVSGQGGYSGRYRLNDAQYSYAVGRWDEAIAASREAMFLFQKSGDHPGETQSHTELALAFLAQGRFRDAWDHLESARRVGTQIDSRGEVLRAVSLERVAQYLFGNLSRAVRGIGEHRESARREGLRGSSLLLILTSLRVAWDTGRFDEAVALADEGQRIARFYSLEAEEMVMTAWKGRSLAARGDLEGRRILKRCISAESLIGHREVLAFMAENTWREGRREEAAELINRAAAEHRVTVRLQGEADDWSDGFFPIEGRLAGPDGPLDVLGEWISGLQAFICAGFGERRALERLEAILEQRNRRIPLPFGRNYALWASLIDPSEEGRERHLSSAFRMLRDRADRIDDDKTKRAWLSSNRWNKLLADEARKAKIS